MREEPTEASVQEAISLCHWKTRSLQFPQSLGHQVFHKILHCVCQCFLPLSLSHALPLSLSHPLCHILECPSTGRFSLSCQTLKCPIVIYCRYFSAAQQYFPAGFYQEPATLVALYNCGLNAAPPPGVLFVFSFLHIYNYNYIYIHIYNII